MLYRIPHSLQHIDRLLEEVVRQVIQPFGDGQLHGGHQDQAGLARRSLGSLAQDLHPRVGQ